MAVNMQFASASPPDVIDSHKLLYESSVVVLGQIVRRESSASNEVDVPRFSIAVHQVIAGASVGGIIDVYPAYKLSSYEREPTPPIGQNEYGMFFLTARQDSKYSFTEAAYPDLPAPAGVPVITEVNNSTQARIAAVLASDFVQAPAYGADLSSQRVLYMPDPLPGNSIYDAAYQVLSEIPREVVIPLLDEALSKSSDPVARGWIVVSLLDHGNTDGLESVVWYTTHPGMQANFPREAFERELSSAILYSPHVAAIVKILASPDPQMRIAAAQALRGIHTKEAVFALIAALKDPIADVRHSAVLAICAFTQGCKGLKISDLMQPANYSVVMAIVRVWSRSGEE
jgi:hypothetical protein